MRRADDFYVQSVGFMPPVVEGRGSEHGAAAPRGNKSSQRRAESQHVYGVRPGFRVAAKGGPHDEPRGAESAQQGAKLDQQVGRRPEAIAANGFMPGNVPVKPGGNTNGCNHVGPDQPGRALRPGRGGCLSHTRPQRILNGKKCYTEYTEWPFILKWKPQ